MAFIDIEKGNQTYRVILGRHTVPTPASQVHPNTQGILLETTSYGHSETSELLMGHENTDSGQSYSQYANIRRHAQDSSIPLFSAEPIKGITHRKRWEDNDTILEKLLQRPLLLAIGSNRLTSYIHSEGEIDRTSRSFGYIQELAQHEESTSNNPIVMRNKVIARRAHRLAAFLEEFDLNPTVTLVVGALHVSIINELAKDDSELVAEILADSALPLYYRAAALHIMHGVQYNAQDNSWERMRLTDTALTYPGAKEE